jgi:glycosyltransferase involved in cell wall biosynthesis
MERHAAVVRFAAQPSPNLLEAEPSTVASHYDLPSNYLYLPNQFWRHKNHDVVVDALAILREQNQDVVIAVSGGADPRDPEYLAGILQKVETRGLQSRFRYLGMIPLAHVYALLRGARALVNPSRFEGWSTTIEEAKSFGVPMVLSELDVHREQTGGNALYFPANEAKVLADRLAYASQMASPGGGARALLPDVDQRVARFATDFISVIQRAADARPLP